jgi:hypothetical protein
MSIDTDFCRDGKGKSNGQQAGRRYSSTKEFIIIARMTN